MERTNMDDRSGQEEVIVKKRRRSRRGKLGCCGPVGEDGADVDYVLALAGNPNVGKSTIFNRLTGMGVVTANYPGKTVELNMGTTDFEGRKIGVIDLPGTYALGGVSEDQWVARQAVLEGNPDVVVAIVDASNLARNLYMMLQFVDLGFPLVVGLNLVDAAEAKGLKTDTALLSEALNVPVIETVATQGKGLDRLMEAAIRVAANPSVPSPIPYGADVEQRINRLEEVIALAGADVDGASTLPLGLPPRALAVLLLEQDSEFLDLSSRLPNGDAIIRARERLAADLEAEHGEAAPMRITRERYGLAGAITSRVQLAAASKETMTERLWRYTTAPISGFVILALVLTIIFGFLFIVGQRLSTGLDWLWALTASRVIVAGIGAAVGHGVLGKTLIWGFDAGLEASLSVGLPYVFTFYFLLALLEDTGYLSSVAFLMDRAMHRLGLHGRAIIPLIAGAGCNVPAIIGTRVLTTQRERTIASTLIVLVPCSARTAVIMGAVSLFVGWKAAVAIFLIMAALVGVSGIGLNRIMPGRPTGLVMEMFPFRAPSLRVITVKTWHRFKDFIFVAIPIVLTGSLVLGFLYEKGWIWALSRPLSPVVEGWLGLPAVAGLTLIFAVLRKELALQLLVALAIIQFGRGAHNLLAFMTQRQIFTYALVNTIYVPCLATIAVLWRELGWRRTILITAFTITLAIVVGGVASRLYGVL
ncbi:MAG: ferrous iron transport protein B [Chloroflexi bacterium]|nr:ferrous iron transport protein B [Chloroflexota bacterium]